MKIFLGADHRGFKLKERIKKWLSDQAFEFEDVGNMFYDQDDDYVDFAVRVGEAVGLGEARGVLLCNSGVGMDLTVNKLKGIRGVLGFKAEQVKESVEKDKANVLCIPAGYVNFRHVKKMLKVFLESEFRQEDRYINRIKKINELEEVVC